MQSPSSRGPKQIPTPAPTDGRKQPASSLASGLYWRAKRWSLRYVPVVLELANNTLTMYDRDDKQVFHAPLSTVQARFTQGGAMHLTVSATHYTLFEIGSPLSSKFSASQQSRLETYNRSVQQINGALGATVGGMMAKGGFPGAVGGVGSVGLDVVALVAEGMAFHDSDKVMNQWRTVLQQNGAAVSGKKVRTLLLVALILTAFAILLVWLGVTAAHRGS